MPGLNRLQPPTVNKRDEGPAKTFTPINLWDVNLRQGKPVDLPLPDGHTSAFLVLSGELTVNGEGNAGENDLAIFARNGSGINISARNAANLLLMDREPIDEPVVGRGPFVMNSRPLFPHHVKRHKEI